MSINSEFQLFSEDCGEGYVDKTMAIATINKSITAKNGSKFLCLARPRRFGKTIAAHMLQTYYSKFCNSKELFEKFKISKDPSFIHHLNKYNVIYLDMSMYDINGENGKNFFKDFSDQTIQDFLDAFPDIFKENKVNSIFEAFKKVAVKTKEKFVFIIDEWDLPLREVKDKTVKKSYLELLRKLFKGEYAYNIALAYMTGIFPIGKYETDSALNNFTEINMIRTSSDLSLYFGLNEIEVKEICKNNNIDFTNTKFWYDGYHFEQTDIYNPYSISRLVAEKSFSSYWTQTGSFNEVLNAINNDVDGIKDVILSLMVGNTIHDINIDTFKNPITEIKDKNSALVYLVHLGYLTLRKIAENQYDIYIPNEEVRREFINNIDSGESIFNGFEQYFENSKNAAIALLNQDTKTVAKSIEKTHNIKVSYKDYNSETALRYVVKDTLFALEKWFYKPFDEIPSQKGIADLVYIPKADFAKTQPVVVIELKWDKSPKNAIKQIEDKDYFSRFKHMGKGFLLVGISYNSKTKQHECSTKLIEQ